MIHAGWLAGAARSRRRPARLPSGARRRRRARKALPASLRSWRIAERGGRLVYWCVLIMVLVSAANAVSRYALNLASNAWLELQWYLFAGVFLLCAGYTLLHNEHIRIDVVSAHLSRRTQVWIDVFGILVFMLPM